MGLIGRFTLLGTEQQHVLIGTPANDDSYAISVLRLEFFKDDEFGIYHTITIPLFNRYNPPVFERGLRLDQAPPPYTNCTAI